MPNEKHLGEFETLVMIALVRLGADAYGASICAEIEKQTGRAVLIGAVYVALERLEKRKYVRSRLGEPTAKRGGRRKKYFELTKAGEAKLSATLSNLGRMVSDTWLEPLAARTT